MLKSKLIKEDRLPLENSILRLKSSGNEKLQRFKAVYQELSVSHEVDLKYKSKLTPFNAMKTPHLLFSENIDFFPLFLHLAV